MVYHFDMDKFWMMLKQLRLGTGTLATRAGVRPDDVQKLIALEEAEADIALKILEVMGREVLAYDPDGNEDAEDEEDKEPDAPIASTALTVNETKQHIAGGTLSLADALAREKKSETPRSTLITWLNEEIAKSVNTTEGG